MLRKLLAPAALLLAAAAPPAGAATFTEPRTLAPWESGATLPAAAPGVSAWMQPGGVWLSDGGEPARMISARGGTVFPQIQLSTGDGRTVGAWTDEHERLHAFTDGDDQVIEGTRPKIRTVAASPTAIAWIGVAPDDDHAVQIATRGPGGHFGAAHEPEQLGEPSHGIVAAGDGVRTLLAWHAQDGSVRRIQTLRLDGSGQGSRWLTGTDVDATSPTVAMAPGGSALLAWVAGMPFGRVTVAPVAADGAIGEPQVLSEDPAGRPKIALGPDGSAVVAWPPAGGGGLMVAVRRPGEARFSPPQPVPAPDLFDWATGVTARGDVLVWWSDGARLQAIVAPAGEGFGAPEEIAAGEVLSLAGADDALTWIESRPAQEGAPPERRVRYTRLEAPRAPGGAPGSATDRRAPRVKLRVLSRRGRRVRVRIRSDERATLRTAWRAGRRTVRRPRRTLRADRPRTIAYKARRGVRRVSVTVKVADAAGNRTTVRRRVRLPRR